jgi:hypothetical protein
MPVDQNLGHIDHVETPPRQCQAPVSSRERKQPQCYEDLTHDATHVIPMGNYVIADLGNYVIATQSNLGNFKIADKQTDTFTRLVISGAERLLIDLAVDSPPGQPPTASFVGPTYAPTELAGRKVIALFDRAEARDFADCYLLADRFGKAELLERAADIDAGFDPQILAQMLRTLRRFADTEIPADNPDAIRAFFTAWADELT